MLVVWTCSRYTIVHKKISRKPICSLGDKFGEPLGGSQASPSFWKVPGLPRKFTEGLQNFPGDLIQRFPESFPGFPRSFPGFPGGSLDFPAGQPLSLGSLTPSPGSQNRSLIFSWVHTRGSCKDTFLRRILTNPVREVANCCAMLLPTTFRGGKGSYKGFSRRFSEGGL